MPGTSSRTPPEPPVVYRDPRGRAWYASEVAQLRVVSPAIDGPNLCLVIRFEREGEERFAHWMGGGESWRSQRSLDRLFAEVEGGLDTGSETGVGPAPAETVALWVKAVATMGPDEARVVRTPDIRGVGPRVVRRPAAGHRATTARAPRVAEWTG